MPWTTPATFTAGSVLTAAQLNTNVRDNTTELYNSVRRLAYQTATANYSISSTTLAGASNIFATSCTWTAAGSTAYRIELVLPNVNSGYAAGDYVLFNLVDGSGNDLGQIGGLGTGNGSQRGLGAIHSVYYYTPAAGSVTINVRGVKGGTQNGNVIAGAGGSGATMPAFLAVFGYPI